MAEHSVQKDQNQQQGIIFSIFNIQKTLIGVMTRKMLKENTTPQQVVILRMLAQEGPIPMKKLGQELFVTPPNITGIIDRLEEKQFVIRLENSKDRRKTEIKLTEKGKKVYQKALDSYRESFQDALNVLTPEEQETLSSLLRKLAKEFVDKNSFESLRDRE